MANRPNVFLISTDHWPAALLGAAGHPVIQTPTLDELARSGVRFSNAYSECPVCIPARRTLMTGTPARTHNDRIFKTTEPMPQLPTLAQTFRDAGYQAYAVGKMHVYPQRDRVGFDDVILEEEGRLQFGVIDDYQLFLADEGFAGQGFYHGMGSNQYLYRPWHLPEYTHPTNWVTHNMARMIKRRDPTRPSFWFASYRHPHPPLAPLQAYLDLYRNSAVDPPYYGSWASNRTELPFWAKFCANRYARLDEPQILAARRAFYALCTHIDHQIRILLGTLREEGLLNNIIICFTSDHGEMLGNHGMWAKRLLYQNSVNVPMILVAPADERVGLNRVDDRLVGWQDVMPTLLDMAGLEIPHTVEGISMVGEEKRDWLYGEFGEDESATRMIHDGQFKLIYYACGNHTQLFDLENDPHELNDLSNSPAHAKNRQHLTELLISQLYGSDEVWVQNGELIGLPDREYSPSPNPGLTGQRGLHWPPPLGQ